jgi:hypothetical protein
VVRGSGFRHSRSSSSIYRDSTRLALTMMRREQPRPNKVFKVPGQYRYWPVVAQIVPAEKKQKRRLWQIYYVVLGTVGYVVAWGGRDVERGGAGGFLATVEQKRGE